MKPVWSFEKHTSLTIGQIEAILFDIKEGEFKSDALPHVLSGKCNCAIEGEGERFKVFFEDGHKEFISMERGNNTLTIQGEWWYKGVYSIHQKSEFRLIRLDVYNIAENHRWVASLLILPEKRKHKANFEQFVSGLEKVIQVDFSEL